MGGGFRKEVEMKAEQVRLVPLCSKNKKEACRGCQLLWVHFGMGRGCLAREL